MLLVFGSINFDIVIRVPHLPQPGETVLGGAASHEPGGKGANQAHAARRFGTPTALVGAIGDDPFGERALERLRGVGVLLDGVRVLPGTATGLACIAVSASGENTIAVAPGSNADVRADWVDAGLLGQARALLLQGEVPLREALALARRCRQQRTVTVMNPAPLPPAPLPPGAVDWLLLNGTETTQLCALLGITETGLAEQARRLARAQQCGLLLTRGALGALLAYRDGRMLHCAALAGAAVDAALGPVVDTTGAGDALAGVFAAALAEGLGEEQALRHAVIAAGLSCRRHGTQSAQADREHILATLAAWDALVVCTPL